MAEKTHLTGFVVVNNIILNREKVACLVLDPGGELKVTVFLSTGEKLYFIGKEATDVWAAFDIDKKSWRDE